MIDWLIYCTNERGRANWRSDWYSLSFVFIKLTILSHCSQDPTNTSSLVTFSLSDHRSTDPLDHWPVTALGVLLRFHTLMFHQLSLLFDSKKVLKKVEWLVVDFIFHHIALSHHYCVPWMICKTIYIFFLSCPVFPSNLADTAWGEPEHVLQHIK